MDGVTFPFTLAGLQRACDEVEAVGGGEVLAPTDLNITLASTPLKVGNRVHLIFTSAYSLTPTFTANASTNVVAAIMPKDTTGAQQYFYVEHAYVSGNRGSGGWIGAGILAKGIYVGSVIKDNLVRSCKGNGYRFDGGNRSPGLGQLLLMNNATADNGEDGWLFTGAIDHVLALANTSEITVAGKASFRIRGVSGTANTRHCFIGNHMESSTACDGFVIENSSGVLLLSTVYDGSGAGNNVIKITGTTPGSDGAFGAAGNLFLNTTGNLATIINDQSAGVTISNTQGRFVDIYRSPKAPDDRITGQVVGVQPARQRAALASAATLVLLKCGWSDADISGTTTITAIKGNDCFLFQEICFWSSSRLQFTDGGNLNLNGNWVGNNAGGKDCLCGKWDGTNFNETHRSLN